ncbi:hypothetical protein SPRG_19277 [Saprolegnia parasitica CBS 223.65]|uniref:Rab-GAP TBC domain-containing protein n=1 Tax=Saprolegnia parasitica (strain CBS 223.65) TaxID=695850 RepID=A0A067D4Q4_SAPPC|nr:hypothetical protein SPRG_19277 [Saprolegnia parasitica CBS 223.65]KDO33666.1 hypothetical protein SPRG_19277 [Saprolegnia parasitica CBS 223.65]|eukprot:XP_012195694.1 hypothetical protein SPRG_19277 [Saprolegnia parasitica CBS 223.65]
MDWHVASGAHALAARSNRSYRDLCRRALLPGAVLEADARQIALDVPRAGVSLYRYVLQHDATEDDSLDMAPLAPYLESLKRILMAYAVRNVRVGYVQGHADVVSFLLGHVHESSAGYDEEHVFWVYCVVMERIFPSDFFARLPKLQGFHVDMDVLGHLITLKLPRLANAMPESDLQCLSSLLAFKWFITVFVGQVPTQALASYWNYTLTATPSTGSIAHFVMALMLLDSATDDIIDSITMDDGDASFAYKIALEHAASMDMDVFAHLEAKAATYALTEEAIEALRVDVRLHPHYMEQEVCALHGITHFDRSQLEQLQLEFQYILRTTNHAKLPTLAGGINKEVLRPILSRVIPEWGSKSLDQLFEVLQPDARGHVDFQRLMLALSKVGHLDVEQMILMAGSLCEIYHNKVSIAAPAMASHPKKKKNKFRSASADTAQIIEDEDDAAALFDRFGRVLPTAFMQKLLRMDVDLDRKLSFREWYQGAMTEPLILRCFGDEDDEQPTTTTNRSRRPSRSFWVDDLKPTLAMRRRSNSSDGVVPIRSPPIAREKALSAASDNPYRRKDGGRISLLSPTTEFELFSATMTMSSQPTITPEDDQEGNSVVSEKTKAPSTLFPEALQARSPDKLCQASFCYGCTIS